jgi:hypothetical protein
MGCMPGESLKGDGGHPGADAGAGQTGTFTGGGGGPSTPDAGGAAGDTANGGSDGTDASVGTAGAGDLDALPNMASDAGHPDVADAGGDGHVAVKPDAGTGSTMPTTYEAEDGSLWGQATVVVCAPCSNGKRVNLKSDSGVSIRNIDANGPGTHMVVVSYTNGDSKGRTLYIGVNGGDSQAFFSVFNPTGAWDKVAAVTISLSGFRAGTNNVISFFIDTEQPPPDLDRIEVSPTTSSLSASAL